MPTQPSWLRFARCWVMAAAASCLLTASGCQRQAQLGPQNRRLILSLRTAVAAHRADWLELNAQAIDDRHTAGSLSDEEFAALGAILAQARAGNWKDAETALGSLAKAQEPADAGPGGISAPHRRPEEH